MPLQPNAIGAVSRRIASRSELDAERLIGSGALRELLGDVSHMHIWRLLNDENYRALKFVRPIVIGRRNYWRLGDVRRWINRRPKKPPRETA